MRTCPGPGSGTRTSSIAISPGPASRAARMAPSPSDGAAASVSIRVICSESDFDQSAPTACRRSSGGCRVQAGDYGGRQGCLVQPVHQLLQPRLPRGARLPVQHALDLGRVAHVDALVAGAPVGGVHGHGAARHVLQPVDDAAHRHGVGRAAAHVEHLARHRVDAVHGAPHGVHQVVDPQDVAHLVAVAVDGDGLAGRTARGRSAPPTPGLPCRTAGCRRCSSSGRRPWAARRCGRSRGRTGPPRPCCTRTASGSPAAPPRRCRRGRPRSGSASPASSTATSSIPPYTLLVEVKSTAGGLSMRARRLQHVEGADDVGLQVRARVVQRRRHGHLRGQVEHLLGLADQRRDAGRVAHVHLLDAHPVAVVGLEPRRVPPHAVAGEVVGHDHALALAAAARGPGCCRRNRRRP